MKGQASVEMLITLGVVIAFTLPVLLLLLSVTSVGQEQTAMAQAQATSRSLADTVNRVYSMGPGAKRIIYLNLPSTTKNVTVSDGEVVVTITTSAGIFEAVSPTFAQVSEVEAYRTIRNRAGLFPVTVECIQGISDYGEVVLRAE